MIPVQHNNQTGPKGEIDTYESSIFIVNGFGSANESNRAGLPRPPSIARPMLLALLFVLRDGLVSSCKVGLIAVPAMRSGIVTVSRVRYHQRWCYCSPRIPQLQGAEMSRVDLCVYWA